MKYLYTLANCQGCSLARNLLEKEGNEFKEIPIDNPLVELGVQVLFKDGQVHAPVMVIPDDGIYFFSHNNFLLIKNLRSINNATSN